MMRRFVVLCLTACCLWAASGPIQANLLSDGTSIDDSTAKADIIVKATALQSRPVTAIGFQRMGELVAFSTRFKVVSTLKGAPGPQFEFIHYDFRPGFALQLPHPASFHFAPGKSYLLWARTAVGGGYRQMHDLSLQRSPGVFRTMDAAPVEALGAGARIVAWNELNFMLASADKEDLTYAIDRLDVHSNNRFGPADFDRTSALRAIAPFIKSADFEIALSAMSAANNGMLQVVQAELIDAATSAIPDSRVAALGVLRNLATPEVRQCALTQSYSSTQEIRAAALKLLANFGGPRVRRVWKDGAASRFSLVRAAVAQAVQKRKDPLMAATLDQLMDDKSLDVRYAASTALLALPPASVRPIWKKRSCNSDFWMVFVNALADTNPAPYRAQLARIIRTRAYPPHHMMPDGRDAIATARVTLLADVRRQPHRFWLAPPNQGLLDALETDNSEYEGPASAAHLYEWYRRAGLTRRATVFRRRTLAKHPAMKTYFTNVDKAVRRGDSWAY